MKQITINPNNEPYYSEDFIKGFKCGAQRQFEADKADRPKEISELKEIALELLEKYETAEDAAMCEYSGNIDEDMRELEKEISDYYERIERADRSRR